MPRETERQGQKSEIAVSVSELKICDLCGWLNLVSNKECFVCGWHGHFEHDPDVVRAAVELAVRRHGRLELQHLTDLRTYRSTPPTMRMRLLGFWRRVRVWWSTFPWRRR
ncbi:MAG: hypothetical protein RMJ43_08635 [Chloroherpetonaceae bacterium]|nr:hypothetical protein [Chthonomonadaceae bacterium]MDW8207889.1 hypothetical protein [Chloroherpetonaceae bacterium]